MTLDELAALEARATPGPWQTDPSDLNPETWSVWAMVATMPADDCEDDEAWDRWYESGGGRVLNVEWFDRDRADRDAALVVAMRNALPALIEVARAAQRLPLTYTGDWTHDDEAAFNTGREALAAALAKLDAKGEA